MYGEKLSYVIINKALYLAHYDAYFYINDDAKKSRCLSVTNNLYFSCFMLIASTWSTVRSMLCHGFINTIYLWKFSPFFEAGSILLIRWLFPVLSGSFAEWRLYYYILKNVAGVLFCQFQINMCVKQNKWFLRRIKCIRQLKLDCHNVLVSISRINYYVERVRERERELFFSYHCNKPLSTEILKWRVVQCNWELPTERGNFQKRQQNGDQTSLFYCLSAIFLGCAFTH